jgi:hypothetical protein
MPCLRRPARRCGVASPDDFYTNACTKRLYQQHVAAMTSRRNTLNGRVYRCMQWPVAEKQQQGACWTFNWGACSIIPSCSAPLLHAGTTPPSSPGTC